MCTILLEEPPPSGKNHKVPGFQVSIYKELKNLACWKFDAKKARVILVNGEIYNLKGAIASGLVGAAIAMKSGPNAYDPEKAAPKDVQQAFDTRFILVTPQNVKDIAAKNGDLFAK